MLKSLVNKAGNFMIIGYQGLEFSEIEYLLEKIEPAGIILFTRNIPDNNPKLLEDVLDNCQKWSLKNLKRPLLIAIDQEGGTVKRLGKPFIQRISQKEVALTETPALTTEKVLKYALEMQQVGFNFNLAPVLDLATKNSSEFMKSRSFGADPHQATKFALAVLKGHRKAKILSCGKHFPGLGDTVIDPHYDLATVKHSLKRYEETELVPFKNLIEAGLESIMTSHVIIAAFDSENPTTFSKKTIQYLRNKLNFQGLLLTDDLEMGAIIKNYPLGKAASKAIIAGHDLVLICRQKDYILKSQEEIIKSIEKKDITAEQIIEQKKRLGKAQKKISPLL